MSLRAPNDAIWRLSYFILTFFCQQMCSSRSKNSKEMKISQNKGRACGRPGQELFGVRGLGKLGKVVKMGGSGNSWRFIVIKSPD